MSALVVGSDARPGVDRRLLVVRGELRGQVDDALARQGSQTARIRADRRQRPRLPAARAAAAAADRHRPSYVQFVDATAPCGGRCSRASRGCRSPTRPLATRPRGHQPALAGRHRRSTASTCACSPSRCPAAAPCSSARSLGAAGRPCALAPAASSSRCSTVCRRPRSRHCLARVLSPAGRRADRARAARLVSGRRARATRSPRSASSSPTPRTSCARR